MMKLDEKNNRQELITRRQQHQLNENRETPAELHLSGKLNMISK